MGPEREEVHVLARVAGFSRTGDQAPGLSEIHAYRPYAWNKLSERKSLCKTKRNMYMLICMGHAINARYT